MKVFDGKILRIDLSVPAIAYEDFGPYREWVGGRAVNQYILFKELPLSISPFDPSNLLVLGAGILAGNRGTGRLQA